MTTIQNIIKKADALLTPEKFQDYCPNGLQVAGKDEINKIITGVTACQALLDQAVNEKADIVLAHHGYFWRDENPCIVGMKRKRIATLIEHNINLVVYHLPLDAHPVYGNNVQLAKKLGLKIELAPDRKVTDLVFVCSLPSPMSANDFVAHVAQCLQRQPLHIPGNAKTINKIALCTGGAQDYFQQALKLGVDAFLTGEISESVVHMARETGIDYIAAGHHATEKYGIQALGEYLAQKLNVEHKFIDIENPV
jgi:dinuclear metal center YbgI/SA1388 family protein